MITIIALLNAMINNNKRDVQIPVHSYNTKNGSFNLLCFNQPIIINMAQSYTTPTKMAIGPVSPIKIIG